MAVNGVNVISSGIDKGGAAGATVYEEALFTQPFFLQGDWDRFEGTAEGKNITAFLPRGATAEEKKQVRKAKYKGAAMLIIVVGEDGAVRDAQVTRSLGAYLDSKAVELVKNWKFEPANKKGKPVAVQLAVEVDFRLY